MRRFAFWFVFWRMRRIDKILIMEKGSKERKGRRKG